jgi:hypothetical protein
MSVKYDYTMRQNMYGSISKGEQLTIVLNRKKLISPWNHTKKQYDEDITDSKYARVFTNTKIGDIVLVCASDADYFIIVKIISELKKEICDDMFVQRKTARLCNHTYQFSECKMCAASIVKIHNCKYEEIVNVEDCTIEPLYSFYKDIMLLHKLKNDNHSYNKIQGSIASNKSDDVINMRPIRHIFENIYTKKKMDDGTILLVKNDIFTDEYTWKRQHNGNLLLTPVKNDLITLDNIKNYEFSHSMIMDVSLNGEEIKEFKYRKIRDCVYNTIGDGLTVIKNSILNIKLPELNSRGFTYNSELGISVQGADSNRTMKEIILQCQKNNISLNMKIKLDDDKIVIVEI